MTSTVGQPFDPQSTGPVLPRAQCRIIAADGREAPAGVAGTIEAKAPFMGGGYWKNGITQPFDGWFRSNDQGYLDPEGRLVVTGRNSDLIGGVMPAAIEDAAYRISGPVEYVTVLPGASTDIDATVFIQSDRSHIQQLARDTLAQEFPTLRLAVAVLPAIPLTEQGKPNRLQLTENPPS